jgi:type IV pilus assembly protein PilV
MGLTMRSIENGFTLTEVMVSVFVLALGVIGVAGMQLTALRTTQQSSFQTVALELATEMAEKMRANASQMAQADELNPFMNVDYKSAADNEPVAPAMNCFGKSASCSAEALAKFDIYEWEKRIKAVLPGGRALICRDARPWDSDIGAYRWPCDTTGAMSNTASVVIKIGWTAKNPDGSLIMDANKQFPPGVAIAVASYTK